MSFSALSKFSRDGDNYPVCSAPVLAEDEADYVCTDPVDLLSPRVRDPDQDTAIDTDYVDVADRLIAEGEQAVSVSPALLPTRLPVPISHPPTYIYCVSPDNVLYLKWTQR